MPKTISIQVENLAAKDAQFLAQVIGLFTDPENREQLTKLRQGMGALKYMTETGQARVVDFHSSN